MSRYHAQIAWDGSDFRLEDQNSKFGTLKFLAGPVRLGLNSELCVQYGRTVCRFSVEKAWSLFSCLSPSTGHQRHLHRMSCEESKEPSTPQVCLPNDGKNSLLVVSRRKYQRLLNREAALIEEAKFQIEDRPQFLKSLTVHSREQLLSTARVLLSRNHAVSRPQSPRYTYRTGCTETIRVPVGDTADDVLADDCVE
ncbi:MAG: FHA domain-containing protein [Candidatus Pacebacteria bacterium]|nr:FHA domain-containing protein [Candidatus Paceibacterota bacterium]